MGPIKKKTRTNAYGLRAMIDMTKWIKDCGKRLPSYGEVTFKIQDGRVVLVEVSEKIRAPFDKFLDSSLAERDD